MDRIQLRGLIAEVLSIFKLNYQDDYFKQSDVETSDINIIISYLIKISNPET